jgi:multiple sugar transport system permease protein
MSKALQPSQPSVQTLPRASISKRRRNPLGAIVLYLVLFAGAIVFLIPFVWMLVTSLKTGDQVMTYPPQWVPTETTYYLKTSTGRVEMPPPLSENTRTGIAKVKGPGETVAREVPLSDVVKDTRVSLRWSNYAETWRTVPFAMFTKNTLMLAILAVIGTTLSACLVAFGFARIRFPGREALFGLMLSTMMLPGIVTLIPGYILFRELGWIDTLKPLWVPAFFGGGAFNVFLLRQFFRTIPSELDEAAKIDGASWLGIFWRVVLPLTGPAVTTVALFTFIGAWKDFMGPLIFINSLEKQTLELGLQTFQTLYGTHWELMMAGAVIVVLPLIIIFFLGQRLFIQGIVMTGLKG